MDNQDSETLNGIKEDSEKEELKTAATKPKVNFKDRFLKLKNKISAPSFFQRSRRSRLLNQRGTTKKNLYIVAGAVILLIIIVVLLTNVAGLTGQRLSTASNQPEIESPLATEKIGRIFEFPFKDDKNNVIGKVSYTIENAEIRNQIYVKGQQANALKGKTFLIVALKLKNDYKQGIKINTRDYIRLSANNNKNEWLAPNIHNDPVEVQAQSIENTRLGFIINEKDSNLLLRIGEIAGPKEEIKLKIK
ncbi:hypothetical protein A2W14_00340 [Candidatus Gottesmanbacteria bacterium RBG_16_37_8]|uniref:DUF4352 domain-containing protein n=1 Tax=Candidatus Gottesmanbacteria bacterium RBG_16_37_8 TaxID=1798371 RepID=A0A1F5YT34_9BACT|nr:MAG: hypothetical protein A2W14_00340 [Candidatus Gottesmanbacteria bacterium RBG_16_37_8]